MTDLREWLKGYFSRHPKMRGFSRITVKSKSSGGSSSHGEARQSGNEIWIFPKFWSHDQDIQDWIFTHEIGHYVLSKYGGANFLKMAQGLGFDPWDTPNLPYGQFNYDEAFADCYAAYQINPSELKSRYPKWFEAIRAIASKVKTAKTVDILDPFEYGPWHDLDRVMERDKSIMELLTDRLPTLSTPDKHVVEFMVYTSETDEKTVERASRITQKYIKALRGRILFVQESPNRWFRLGRPEVLIRAEFRVRVDPNRVQIPKSLQAKYKNKKKIKTKDGDETTVYEYGPRQVANRNKAKAERVEKLRKSMSDLRKKVMSDLENPAALAIALMDETFERVGNAESAKEGHFGVTGWKPEHVKFQRGKAILTYVGKSGVKQKKTITNAKLVKALKEACDDESCETLVNATAQDVNEYLKPFDITAKDIRGFHANREMQNRLRKHRSKGPSLPKSRKEKDRILKDEFKKALEETAKAVGHEPSTLKSQYLVPGMENSYLHDGTVIKELAKSASLMLEVPGEYIGDVRKDRFVHFTTLPRARQILEDNRLLMRPPYPKFGTDAVNAVSLTYGAYVPRTQTTHYKEPLVAVLFTTSNRPDIGFVEEVVWKRDVAFNSAKIIPASKAISMLRKTPEQISEDAFVRYAGRKPKGEADREDEQVGRMVRKAPKKKPPRQDLRNNRPLKERDKDLEGIDRQDGGDKDLQDDLRRMSHRLAFRWLALPTTPSAARVATLHLAREEAKKPGDVWFNEKNRVWVAMNPNKAVQAFEEEDRAKAFAKGEKALKKEDSKSPKEDPEDSKEDFAEESEEDSARERAEAALNDSKRVVRDLLGEDSALSDSVQDKLSEAMRDLSETEMGDFSRALTSRLNALVQMDGASDEALAIARDASEFTDYDKIKDPAELGRRLAEAAFAENVVANPNLLESTLEDSPGFTSKDATKASTQAFEHFQALTSQLREEAAIQLQEELNEIEDQTSERAQEINAILNGIAVAEIAATGRSIIGRPSPSAAMAALTRKLVEQGNAAVMFAPAQDYFTSESQGAFERALADLSPRELFEVVGGDDEDSPYHPFKEMLTGDNPVPAPFDQGVKSYLINQHIQDMTWNDRAVRDAQKASGKKFDDPKERQNIVRKAKKDAQRGLESQFQKCLEAIQKARAAGKVPDKSDMDCVESFVQSEQAVIQADNTRDLLEALEKEGFEIPSTPSFAVLRKFAETGDPELLKTTTQPNPESYSGDQEVRKTSSSRFSSYTGSLMSEGPCPVTTITPFGRNYLMPKTITKKGAMRVTADLDRLANLFQYQHEALRLPKAVATDLAKRLDTVSSHLEIVSGLDKSAKMDPPANYTEENLTPGEFDPADIGEEDAEALERNRDEPYMDTFKQDEFDQLREVQQTGMFSNAKAARSLLRRLAGLAQQAEKKKVASLDSLSDEDLKKVAAKLADVENEILKRKRASNQKVHGYNLFA